MFEKASRMKLRFVTASGLVTVEDLWDMPLIHANRLNLDDIARALHRQLKSMDDVSFVNPDQEVDETLQLKFDIVKHIIDVRVAENKAVLTARANREKKQKLLEIISQKENEGLMNTSLDELRKMAESL